LGKSAANIVELVSQVYQGNKEKKRLKQSMAASLWVINKPNNEPL